MIALLPDVLLLVCSFGVAQAIDGNRLTLEQALAMAERNNAQLKAAAAQREGATAGILTARAYPNPDFNVLQGNQYSRWNNGNPGAPGMLQHYSVHQPLELPSVRSARIGTARLGRDSSEFALTDVRIGVRAAVKHAFYQVLRRRGEIDLYQENLRLVEDLRRRIQVQVDVGEAARLELTRAEAEVATARTFARSAQLRLVTAVSALQAVVSAPLPQNLELAGALDPPTALPTLDQLRQELITRHPTILYTQNEVRRAQGRLQTERALRAPQPTFHSEYEHQPDLGFYRFGISLPIPIWNRREGPIAEAVAGVSQAEAIAELRRVELTAALERAYGTYQVASEQITSFQEGVLREAEAALRASEAAFRFGERGIIEVLDAQRILRNVRIDYLNAQFDRQAAAIELEQLRAIAPQQMIP